jgi:dUTP pyrophosphatase
MTNDCRNGKTVTVKRGEAFAQGIITQYFVTENDNANAIRNGGFGSTSK